MNQPLEIILTMVIAIVFLSSIFTIQRCDSWILVLFLFISLVLLNSGLVNILHYAFVLVVLGILVISYRIYERHQRIVRNKVEIQNTKILALGHEG